MRRFSDRFTCTFDVPPDVLWRTVSDTAAINRDTGFPPVRYTHEPTAGGPATTVAHARLGPLALEWEEPPFTWEAPHRVAVERRFRRGPFARFASDVRVVADGDGTRIEHDLELDANGAVGALLAPAVLARCRAGAERAYALAARRARASAAIVPAGGIAHVARFVDALEALRPHTEHEPAIAARLAALVEHADDETVARMRPYVLADAWQLPRDRVLGAMLAATRSGLLDLSWTLICPSCRGQKNSVATLARVGGSVHCESCGIAYPPEFDRNVEVTFDARPSGRSEMPAVYGIGGPEIARQTLAQMALPPGGEGSLLTVLRAGAYVVQALPDRVARFTVEDDAGASSLGVRVNDDGVRAGTSVVQSGAVRVRIENASTHTAVVRITEAELTGQIATAADVTALQAFRDLFPSEVPAPGVELAIRALTVVFTDVAGSTLMYAESGDSHAYRLVREHFDAVHDVIALHRGAVVKTMGDSMMAVFADPRDAVEAAREFGAAAAPLELRIGLHRGPCIAVRANDRLDYFGATVNLAARVAHAASAGEILITAAVADDARVADVLPDGERGTVALRGIPSPVDVVLIRAPRCARPRERPQPAVRRSSARAGLRARHGGERLQRGVRTPGGARNAGRRARARCARRGRRGGRAQRVAGRARRARRRDRCERGDGGPRAGAPRRRGDGPARGPRATAAARRRVGRRRAVVADAALSRRLAPGAARVCARAAARGRLVLSTHHPALTDDPAADYHAVRLVEEGWDGFSDVPVPMRFYHRPLERIVGDVLAAGFVLRALREPRPSADAETRDPVFAARLRARPWFLIVDAEAARG